MISNHPSDAFLKHIRQYILQKSTIPKETPHDPVEPEAPNLPTEPDDPDFGIPISSRLGINTKTNQTALNDLTNEDGNEDPGSELDTEFSKNVTSLSPPINTMENSMTEKQIDQFLTIQQAQLAMMMGIYQNLQTICAKSGEEAATFNWRDVHSLLQTGKDELAET